VNRDLIVQAFPGQPRMQAAFETLVNNAEDATSRLSTALEAIGTLGEGAEGILAALAGKQAKNDTLDAISLLGPDPGALEQIQAGIFAIRPIDAADVKSLLSRELADTRYLGGAHTAASATKLATARNIAMTGDVAWSVSFDGSANASSAGTIAANAVTFSKMVAATAASFVGATAAGNFSQLTATQATSLLNVFSSTLKGLAPASGGGTANFLRADGTWAAPAGPTGAALTKTDDTNVTLTLGGSPTSALLAASSITVGWSGQLAVARGGTGIASYAVGDLIYASAATTLSKLADVATGNVLISGGVATAPSWGKVDLTAHITGRLPFANLAQGLARSVLGVTGNAGADVASIQGTADQVLVINTAGTGLAFGTVATGGIANDAVTYAKMQNVSATNKLLGRTSAGAGDPEEIDIGAWTDFSGTCTVTAGAGAFTTVSVVVARYKKIGRIVFVRITILITTNGTANSYFTVTAPFASASVAANGFQPIYCTTTFAAALAGRAALDNNSTTIYVTKYDGTYLGQDSLYVHLAGSYEAA
jgi:hypothetical protein